MTTLPAAIAAAMLAKAIAVRTASIDLNSLAATLIAALSTAVFTALAAVAPRGGVVPGWDACARGRRDRTHPTSGAGLRRPGTAAPRRLAALAAALLTFFFATAAPAAPAFAQSGCAGVTVVVDFGPLAAADAAEPATGCAADPANGLDALAQAGFSVTEVASIRGMVCRIDELPESTCATAPPAKEYWSYWHAEAGDAAWSYSPVGGADSSPDAGDVEGWSFGDGSAPALAPADAAAAAEGAATEAPRDRSYTWLFAVAALAVIAGLVFWRVRRDRRA
ncbi:hypothetical protein [Glycomyces tritici]|uniref:Uncharacterized protein n=1 Tax=Glycomyces tritici TaxID=2665176 RepID=A0ABT7YYU0_9ACTN|nr:hypothetical protein [Glycomyces tritici]MDN3243823.1 hypothetical protein [Glycomyces tritici]